MDAEFGSEYTFRQPKSRKVEERIRPPEPLPPRINRNEALRLDRGVYAHLEIVSRNRLFEILHLQDINIGSYAAYEAGWKLSSAPEVVQPATGEAIARCVFGSPV